MTADEMFDELGYEKREIFGGFKFYKDNDNTIIFDEANKSFIKQGEYGDYCDDITVEELKAINKKCEELGWI